MREILFKAKRIDNGEWVEGAYIYCKGATTVSFQNEHYILVFDGYGVAWHEVVRETICQYTGLTDKNGKKIWENDICHYHDTHNDICVIRFGEYKNNHVSRHMGFYTDWQTFDYMFRQDLGFWANKREIEVIGNIFDNPELLKGGVKNE